MKKVGCTLKKGNIEKSFNFGRFLNDKGSKKVNQIFSSCYVQYMCLTNKHCAKSKEKRWD